MEFESIYGFAFRFSLLQVLPLDDKVLAEGGAYHRSCFKCSHCNGQLSLITMAAYKGKLFCKRKFRAANMYCFDRCSVSQLRASFFDPLGMFDPACPSPPCSAPEGALLA